MRRLSWLIAVLLCYATSAGLAFVANIYAPKWFWFVSFGALVVNFAFALYDTRRRTAALAAAFLINSHYLGLSIMSASAPLFVWALFLIAVQVALLWAAALSINRVAQR